MQKLMVFKVCSLIVACIGSVHSQGISESLDGWTLGEHRPEIVTGRIPNGNLCRYMHFPVGTDMARYMVLVEGEGGVMFWIFDPGECDSDTNPPYDHYGPAWGLVNALGVGFGIGIYRDAANRGCRGYSVVSTENPEKAELFAPETRDLGSLDREPRWQLWEFFGTWDNITITHYDTDYMLYGGTDSARTVFGNLSKTYDATSNGGAWASVFRQGWKGVFVKGDDSTGVEAIDLNMVPGGSGVFYEFVHWDCVPPIPPITITGFPENDTVPAGSLYTGRIAKSGGCQAYHTYTVNQAPEGMRVYYITGNIEWTPTADQIGDNYLVMGSWACTLTVVGGSAISDFQLPIPDFKTIRMEGMVMYDLSGRTVICPGKSGVYIIVNNGNIEKRVLVR